MKRKIRACLTVIFLALLSSCSFYPETPPDKETDPVVQGIKTTDSALYGSWTKMSPDSYIYDWWDDMNTKGLFVGSGDIFFSQNWAYSRIRRAYTPPTQDKWVAAYFPFLISGDPYLQLCATLDAKNIDGSSNGWDGYTFYSELRVFRTLNQNLLKVEEALSSYLHQIYYMRKNSIIKVRGSLVMLGQGTAGVTLPITSSAIVVSNSLNAEDRPTVTVDADGSFFITNLHAGIAYSLAVGTNPPIQIIPRYDDQDMGVICVQPKPYNFKVWISHAETYLYDETDQAITVHFANYGKTTCSAASYTITMPPGVELKAGLLKNMLGEVPAGGEKTVSLTIRGDAITADFKDMGFAVSIIDIGNTDWRDSFQVRLYREGRIINIRSLDAGVSGSIYSSQGQMSYFGASNETSVTIPSGLAYKVAVMGAGLGLPTRYSIGNNVPAASDAEMLAFTNPGAFEPDDSEEIATVLSNSMSQLSYITLDDIDFFSIPIF